MFPEISLPWRCKIADALTDGLFFGAGGRGGELAGYISHIVH